MTPTAKQQLEDLLNEALDEQRQLAIKKLEGIINRFKKKYTMLVDEEFILRKQNLEELAKLEPDSALIKRNDRQLDLIVADVKACLHSIRLLKEGLDTL